MLQDLLEEGAVRPRLLAHRPLGQRPPGRTLGLDFLFVCVAVGEDVAVPRLLLEEGGGLGEDIGVGVLTAVAVVGLKQHAEVVEPG